MRCVIITGLSGAGRSLALRQFEDMGYFCVDNMPPQMMTTFASMCNEHNIDKAALVVDTRVGVFFDSIYEAMDEMEQMGVECEVLYLETADDVLIRRYKESRRKHPMNPTSIMQGIEQEKEMLAKLRGMARYVLDTSALSPKQFSEQIWGLFAEEARRDKLLPVIVSFGYKNGIPLDADLAFDVRFLPNPYYVPELRAFNGTQQAIREFVYSYEQTRVFEQKLVEMILYLLPYYQEEGKFQLVIGIGCTGGMHRSVALAEGLQRRLKENGIYSVVQHRDIRKDAQRD